MPDMHNQKAVMLEPRHEAAALKLRTGRAGGATMATAAGP